VQAVVVEPGDPLDDRQLGLGDRAPGSFGDLELAATLGQDYPTQCLRPLAEVRVIKIDRAYIDALPPDLDVMEGDGACFRIK
jgi:hypothetical protein